MNTKRQSTVARVTDANGLIGEIYDCAIAPERWKQTLKIICQIGNFRCAALNLLDRQNKNILLQQCYGVEEYWLERYSANSQEYGEEIHRIRSVFFKKQHTDAPIVLSRDVSHGTYSNLRYYKEWMKPQQLIDIMQLLVMHQPDRVGAFNFSRHEQWGLINDEDIELGTLLLPHLRRAITISNLLEVQSLRASNLRSTIGSLSTGVMLLAEDGTILEANRVAERMIEQCSIACIVDGRLTSHDPQHAAILRKALQAAAKGEAGSMSDVSTRSSGRVVSSYILPLGGGDLRPNIRETAVGAMFITSNQPEEAQLPRATILGVLYNLTAAEIRVVEALADGKTSLQAAMLLGISEATIRTHLTRIFVKTSTTRQAELVSLTHRLALPLSSVDRTGEK